MMTDMISSVSDLLADEEKEEGQDSRLAEADPAA
jgi:hypothetical protein